FEGKNIAFRFRYVTDNTIAGTGWYVDDILLNKEPAVYNLGQLFNGAGTLVSLSDTVTSITSEVLPLTWASFNVVKQNKEALLNWVTFQESNTDHFIVEKSKDGIHFNEINRLLSAGNTSGTTSYSIIDYSPFAGLNYYRIAQIDRNGKLGYSPVRTLDFDRPKNLITVTPNPAKDKILITIENNSALLNATMVNVLGETILQNSIKQERNQIDISSLPSGIYFLKITGKDINEVKKIVKH
ncbi:MAG: T9SS type A sorting domain-containing protein, partial [Bacteroidetes bacterium]|nr:T9SS type A sorting domain-containing protein [Bacteroidota bacterium]